MTIYPESIDTDLRRTFNRCSKWFLCNYQGFNVTGYGMMTEFRYYRKSVTKAINRLPLCV